MNLLPFQYVTEKDQLLGAVRDLSACSEIGVDIEGDSLFHYQDRVCLIQITGNGKNFIFDPLLLDSVESLSVLFQNERIVKIFHGAEYDLISLKRDFKFSIISIFDTVLAARALGLKAFSLQHLVWLYFNIPLEKTHQKANWSRRPVPKDQLEYAYKDTFFLPELYEKLSTEVKNKGRWDQIEEECHLLEKREWDEKRFSSEQYLKLKGAKELLPDSQKVLRELVVTRENLSREVDRPPFKVISNEDLLQMATGRPHSLAELKLLFPRESAPVYRNPAFWIKAIHEGEQSQIPLPVKAKKNGTPPTPEEEKRFSEMKKWRDSQAVEEGVEPAMILSTDMLRAISSKTIEYPDQLLELGLLRHWQFKRYAAKICSFFPKSK
ncbi:MAG: HRDC domain-containing protein [Nitrospirae bacterium]|nr:HRDC domain-containing protein [Nitrospirota bacterium]MBI3594965.1 HRDC domain-containing protein [Nitrospirota bacterium]